MLDFHSHFILFDSALFLSLLYLFVPSNPLPSHEAVGWWGPYVITELECLLLSVLFGDV